MLIKHFKAQLFNNGYLGDFHDDYATRLVNATDNSIYELLPIAVAQPKTVEDLSTLISTANQSTFTSIALTARGGGTGTNGQSLTNSIVVDLSRHMNKIIEFDPHAQTITVEPGLILSDLNRFLQPHGLFFAPDVSTANRATVGGMIATDAAGKGSLIYGKTLDSLHSLKVILADGYIIDTQSIDTKKIPNETNERLATIYSSILNWLKPVQEEIEQRFPALKRPLSGYNIKRCYQDDKLDLTPIFCGSEGTLGIVAAATLKLLPIPKCKTLVVVHYDSFIAALKDAETLIKFKPLAIEAVDEKVQKSAQTLPNWPSLAKLLNSENKNYVSNFIEFVANDHQELIQTIAHLERELCTSGANYVVITDHRQIEQLWSIRSLAVGLAGKMPGQGKPVAFIEDAIVPPENLANFVAELQQLLEKEKLQYAMYGHVDVGCIHVRPALDLQQESDRQKIRPITEMVISLLSKYHGILWGEHGKGFRGEFVPDVFGPILYPILCQIKRLFDPNNRFNPGKLAAPTPEIQLDRIEKIPMRGSFDQMINPEQQNNFSASMVCNGNGACFNKEPSNVMCPSYKVTGDRIHSPKGRAMLVKEWLRKSSMPEFKGQERQVADMAFDALSSCLGCKGCLGKCPTQVSIPDIRSKFLDQYHRQFKRRTIRELALGHIENLLPLFAKYPRSWNFLHQYRLIPSFGLKNIPLFTSSISLLHQLKTLGTPLYTAPKQTISMAANSVVIFADVFTGLLNPEVLISAVKLLKKMDYIPYIIYPRSSGKSFVVGGFLKKFKSNTQTLSQLFNPLFAKNIPIIGLENTITLMFRDEVKKFATSFDGQVQTLAEFIHDNINKLPALTPSIPVVHYKLLPHCTEQAILPDEALFWKNIFGQLNRPLEVQNLGCCGMAGSYGYQREYLENSKQLFTMNWMKALNDHGVELLATGFSCRCQSKQQANKIIHHPIQIAAGFFD